MSRTLYVNEDGSYYNPEDEYDYDDDTQQTEEDDIDSIECTAGDWCVWCKHWHDTEKPWCDKDIKCKSFEYKDK
jgi:uncharacterized membrane protein YcgQ (UPF0703/DUF1980 family)